MITASDFIWLIILILMAIPAYFIVCDWWDKRRKRKNKEIL